MANKSFDVECVVSLIGKIEDRDSEMKLFFFRFEQCRELIAC